MTRTMMTLDIPNLSRNLVGFDRLFNDIERNFSNSQSTNYPPYNIVEINENEWTISLAVAGFAMDDLEITLDKNVLNIEGNMSKSNDDINYVHKGISSRSFRRSFTLAEHIEVEDAKLDLGILSIHLKRNVPEDLQPKRITIKV